MRKFVRTALTGTAVAALAAGAMVAPGWWSQTRDGQAEAAAVDDLKRDLDAIVNQPGSKDAIASVLVRDAASGDDLYSHDGAERLVPASNNKLFTEAAALHTLGADHRFSTDVLATGRAAGTVKRLYLRGGGDPTLLPEDYDALAKNVAASGITTVTGGLVADDTRYDDVRLGPFWSWDDESAYYSGQVSALTLSPNKDYDAGTAIVEVRPGKEAGAKGAVSVVPRNDYLKIVNETKTTADGDASISVDREHGTNTVVVSGSIPVGAKPSQSWVTVWEPTAYAASVFRDALERHGVQVVGKTRTGATSKDASTVVSHQSMTLAELSVPFMKLSNNGHAEVLIKEMGREASGEGSWEAGTAARDEALADLGVDTSAQQLVDGSGLARADFVPPRQITNLLLNARKQQWYDDWTHALPVAGDADRLVGGTLRNRMKDTPAAGNVRAKTGSLTGVSALSGYVTDADGKQLVFSIMHNNHLELDVKGVEDKIAVRLAEFSRSGRTPKGAGVPTLPKPYRGPVDVECSWVKAC